MRQTKGFGRSARLELRGTEENWASQQQVIKAFAYISSRNYAMREEGSCEALAYALRTLLMIEEQYNVDVDGIQGIEEN